MSIIALALLPVNPATLPVPTVAEHALADRLAHLADGGDPDAYRPGWEADAYSPTVADFWEQRGYSIGQAGELVDAADAFPDADASTLLRNRFWFAEGLHKGFAAFAKEVGYERGLAGGSCELPDSIPGRYEFYFQNGWHSGDMEADERAGIMADYWQQLDWEHSYENEMAEIDAINREAGGWFRFAPSMID